ncbi:envelope stress response membrane protein PspC [Vibrio ziniensis]|uniref:Envelope stress response membrane protein PspC n=1 Tax=Vibrio ziniensis TaxID=2711221 RepID=A0A6G7CIU7_9VIBR|nr:envelope stress response membrane protein PspC [Vibrio ziniensis]QIH42037.1 envelope stress response membrane protein PspC [Vibrio ziniensis]
MNSRELYRDPVNGKLGGVCAGLANYFGLEVWVVRILVISAGLLGGGFLIVLAYVALMLMLEKQPYQYQQTVKSQREHTLKSKPWEQGQAADALLNTLNEDLNKVEKRVRNMEAYVTSEAFNVNREFKKL